MTKVIRENTWNENELHSTTDEEIQEITLLVPSTHKSEPKNFDI